jgi:hypothetical protein
MNALELEFHQDMVDGIRRCQQEISYNPTYWCRMVAEHGGVGAARLLLQGPPCSDGFIRLWKARRLDLSVEFSVLLPKYHSIFSAAERDEARRRLEAHRFDVDTHLRQITNGTGVGP